MQPRRPVVEGLTIEAGGERRLPLPAVAGRLIELSVEPTRAGVEVALVSTAGKLPVWHDGRRGEHGTKCAAGRVTTLRWIAGADPAAELHLLATAATPVTLSVASRPASPAEAEAWNAHRRLVDSLTAGELETAAGVLESTRRVVIDATGDDEAVAYLEELAHRLVDAGLNDPAAETLKLALARHGDRPEDEMLADLKSGLSTARFYQGDWDAAFDLEHEALEIRRRVVGPDHPDTGRSLVELAVVRWQQAAFRDAARLATQALAVLDRPSTDPVELAEAFHVQGEILRELGRFEASEAALRGAVATWESTGRRGHLHAATLNGLAKILRDRGRYVEAERLISRALAFSAEDPATPLEDSVIWRLNKAELLRLGGQAEDAEKLYRRQLEDARELFGEGNADLLMHLNQTAVFLTETERYDEAATLFSEVLDLAEQTLEVDHPVRAQALEDLGVLERRRQRLTAAESALRESLEIRRRIFGAEHPEVALTLTGLAETLAQDSSRDTQALSYLDRALRVFSQTPIFPDVRARALALRAELLDRDGRRDQATRALEEALVLIEGLRSTAGTADRSLAGFFGRYRELYHRMVGWQVDAGRLDRAFEYSERARGRAFLDQLAAHRVDLLEGLDEERRKQLDRQRQDVRSKLAEAQFNLALEREYSTSGTEIDRWERRTRELVAELQALDAAVRAESPLWLRLVTRGGRPATPADVQRVLLSDVGLFVAYDIGPERSFAFVIPPDGPLEVLHLEIDAAAAAALRTEPGPLRAATLDTAVGRALPPRSGAVRGLDPPKPRGSKSDDARHALWRILMPPPLASRAATAEELVVVPDGALHHLPLELLVPELQPDGRAAGYWLETGPVTRYGLSATVLGNLERLEREPRPGGGIVIVSDPRPAEGQGLIAGTLRDLPWTAKEAEAIADVLQQAGLSEIVTLTGEQAREAALRQSLAAPLDILHIASHGIVEEGGHELLAALALTPPATVSGAGDDGLLQLHEIYELELALDLAVLSACETHRGRDFAGEGAFALSRGFLVAGAKRVIASLWPVDDRRTAELMASFYRHLFAEGPRAATPVDRALRDAKVEMLNRPESSDPYFWAGFVLTGPSRRGADR